MGKDKKNKDKMPTMAEFLDQCRSTLQLSKEVSDREVLAEALTRLGQQPTATSEITPPGRVSIVKDQ